MHTTQPLDRAAVLLKVLGDDVADAVLGQLSPERGEMLRKKLGGFAQQPPSDGDVDDVVEEFERFFRFAIESAATELNLSDESSPKLKVVSADDDQQPARRRNEDERPPFQSTGDSIEDLSSLEPYQIAGGIKGESPRTIAMIVSRLEPTTSARTLQFFPADIRSQVFLQFNDSLDASTNLIQRIAAVAVKRGLKVQREDLEVVENQVEQLVADMLRAMVKSERNEVLENLDQHNPEMASRVRELLYVFEDLCSIADRSLQKLLGEINTTSLATALSDAEEEVVSKIFNNMSKRARESLSEEMELMTNVPPSDREAARDEIVAVIQRLDQDGELIME